jgi:MFS family permease
MSTIKNILLAAGSLLVGAGASAQPLNPVSSVSLTEFSRQRIQHQRVIGYSLGGYALANIVGSAIAQGQTTGESRSFHQMNVYWNAVNLAIAGVGLFTARKQNRIAEPSATESLTEAVSEHNKLKKILLINAGLDVLYVSGGAYLANQTGTPDTADRNRGFGKAIAVQGGFLLLFDLVNYAIVRHRDPQRDALLQATPNGVGLVLPIR